MEARRRVSLQRAYVLHQRPYRNSSILAEVITPDHGRLGLVARGVRSNRSRHYGLMQPFRPLLLSWSARGDLGSLDSAEGDGGAHMLSGMALMSGFYLNELLMRLLHRHDPHPSLYYAYDATLRAIGETDRHFADPEHRMEATPWYEQALRLFEKTLLAELGYGLVLDHDIDTREPIDANRAYVYIPDSGPRLAESGSGEGVRVSGRALLALASDTIDDEGCLREIKHLMRALLDRRLGGKPLQSRVMFADMMAMQR